MDAEDSDAAPVDADDGGEQVDAEDEGCLNDVPNMTIARPGRAGKSNFCSRFGCGGMNRHHRWGCMEDAANAHCRRHENGANGEVMGAKRTENNVTDGRKDRRAQDDQTYERDHQQDDGGGLTGKAKKDAEDADTRESIFGHLRVGEAKHPGPEDGIVGARQVLPWSGDRPQDGLKYPAPHRPGFRDILTLGCQEDEGEEGAGRRAAEEAEPFALQAETVNATAWGPLKK